MKSLREQKKKGSQRNKKVLVAVAASAFFLLIVGGGWYAWQRNNANITLPATTADNEAAVKTQTQPTGEVSPTTDLGKSESVKDNGEQPAPPPTSNGKKQVTLSLSYAGYTDNTKQQVEIDAFVTGVFEEGGTCTMTATKGGQKVTARTTGHQNVSQTRCDNFVVERSRFPSAGAWSVVVTYESATAQGASSAQNMEL